MDKVVLSFITLVSPDRANFFCFFLAVSNSNGNLLIQIIFIYGKDIMGCMVSQYF
jgi:hypothetical protein